MKKILIYDCFAGISGDMNLGALIDLGVNQDELIAQLEMLGLSGFSVYAENKMKNGITGTQFHVSLSDVDVKHRTFEDIQTIIQESALNEKVKNLSLKIFKVLAIAEGKVHGIPFEKVHFHEVGALDSIVDIVGAAIALDLLGVDELYTGSIQLGGGMVRCEHGLLPVPAPATAELVKGFDVKTGLADSELTTPTGAAILKALAKPMPEGFCYQPVKYGYGFGTKEFDFPNALRILEVSISQNDDERVMVEANIDDMNPEWYEYISQKLFSIGVDDVFISAITMKKGRPANKISVLCREAIREDVMGVIFAESSCIGLRYYKVHKAMLERENISVVIKYGAVNMKISKYNGRVVHEKPEYEDCKKIASEKDIGLKEVYKMVEHEYRKQQKEI